MGADSRNLEPTFVYISVKLGGGGEIVLGQTVRAAGGKPVFLQGEVVVNPKTGLPQFVPGTYDGETGKFVPGMVVDTIDGPMFVEGMLHRYF